MRARSSAGRPPLDPGVDILAELGADREERLLVGFAAETERLVHMEDELHKRVIGQEDAIKAVSQAIRRTRAGGQSDGFRNRRVNLSVLPVTSGRPTSYRNSSPGR